MKSNSRINKQQQVQVVIRLKPQWSQQKQAKCAYLSLQNSLVVQTPSKKQHFIFDHIASQSISQHSLYTIIGRQAVTQSLLGYNCCIFAYGQTGSGKTYSILGSVIDLTKDAKADTRGILPRLLQDLFSQCKGQTTTVRCSYMEIYNQQIFDLLGDGNMNLQVREDIKRGVFVENLNQARITLYQDAINLLLEGQKNRKIAATSMNSESSRSHTIFTIHIQSQITEQDTVKFRRSKINIVDLAGSERVKHTNVQGQRLRQGCNINRSLHVLGNVINALVQSSKKKKHIPFRDSKLTYYLKDSLGGNSITKLLANIQTSKLYLGDTLSTLMFAKRAKILKMKVQVNQKSTQNYQSLRNQIKKLREQLAQAKYINQTRLSQRANTEHQTDGVEKEGESFQGIYSQGNIKVFEQNQLHYKALIQIYEEHMKQCSKDNEGYNRTAFNKPKNNTILSHSQWKKLQKRNLALTQLLKKVPAFTKIYHENMLLKQQRACSRPSLALTQCSSLSTLQSPPQLCMLLEQAIKNTSIHYQQLISQLTIKFNQSLNLLDQAYVEMEREVQIKDKIIKDMRSNLQHQKYQELLQDNQYLKLNVLQLEEQIHQLDVELQHYKIQHKQQTRRHTLAHEPLSLTQKKGSNSKNWLSMSMENMHQHFQNTVQTQKDKNQLKGKDQLQNNHVQEQDQQKQTPTEIVISTEIIQTLKSFKSEMEKQGQQYKKQRQVMLQCIWALQKQCRKLSHHNQQQILSLQVLKEQKSKLLNHVSQSNPFSEISLTPSLALQTLQSKLSQQILFEQHFEQYKSTKQQEIQELYKKLQKMSNGMAQLEDWRRMEQQVRKGNFGKTIRQLLNQYDTLRKNQPNYRFANLTTHADDKLLTSRSSKNLNITKLRQDRQYDFLRIDHNNPTKRNNSKYSARKSKDQKILMYKSPQK